MRIPINKVLRKIGFEVRRYKPKSFQEFVSLSPKGPTKGTVLLAYIVEPFLLSPGKRPSQAHTHHTESTLIADSFLELGYGVDVIDYRNPDFQPKKKYTFFVSARTHFTKIAKRLNSDCIKIVHLDTAHFLFNNSAAYRRLHDLKLRRSVSTASLKVVEHNFAPEHADFLTMLGNSFTKETYRYTNKPIFPLPVPSPDISTPARTKNIDGCRKNFLWLGSEGLVHKGLDLVLEVFSELPEYQLTVCGPIDTRFETHFKEAYHRELFELPNINTVGWIDVSSEKFLEIAKNCIALVYPSSSEGQAGSVITCLKTGLIPVVSYESGVDVADFGIVLETCTQEEIRSAVLEISSKPIPELEKMVQASHDYVNDYHSKENYLSEFKKIIETIQKRPI